jgi:hypothetical protein
MRGQLPFNLLERCLKFFPIQGKDLTCVVSLGRRRSLYSADPRKISLRTFADLKGKGTNICRFKKGRSRTCADFKREGHKTPDFKREGHEHFRILKEKVRVIFRF